MIKKYLSIKQDKNTGKLSSMQFQYLDENTMDILGSSGRYAYYYPDLEVY